MKHQYFGDINDYRKYGLLRALREHSGLSLGVCWMLTPNDDRADGKFIAFLEEPASWRAYDPTLFDVLAAVVPTGRHLGHISEHQVVRDALYVDAPVPDDRIGRQAFYTDSHRSLRQADLVFFDPDNGVEIPSCPAGRKNSSKYVMRREIAHTYAEGQSVLIYQHFIREDRDRFIERLTRDLRLDTGCKSVICFRTANVAFLLLPQQQHAPAVATAVEYIGRSWGEQIRISFHNGA